MPEAAAPRTAPAAEEHRTDEEERILPLCERYVTAAEWNAMGRGDYATPKQLVVFLSALEANNTQDDVSLLIDAMPTPLPAVLRPLLLKPLDKRYRRLLGGLKPPRRPVAAGLTEDPRV